MATCVMLAHGQPEADSNSGEAGKRQTAGAFVGPTWTASRPQGRPKRGRMRLSTKDWLQVDDIPLEKFSRLTNLDREMPRKLQPDGAVRLVRLTTGEQIVAQIGRQNKPNSINLQWAQQRLTVALKDILLIALPDHIDEQVFWTGYSRQNQMWLGSDGQPVGRDLFDASSSRFVVSRYATLPISPSVNDGEFTIRLNWSSHARLTPGEGRPLAGKRKLEFLFEPNSGESVKTSQLRMLTLFKQDSKSVAAKFSSGVRGATSPVSLDGGDFFVRLSMGTGTVLVVNDTVVARTARPLGRLKSVRLVCDPKNKIGIGTVTLWKSLAKSEASNPKSTDRQRRHSAVSSQQASLSLSGGNELFGELLELSSQSASMRIRERTVRIPINQIRMIRPNSSHAPQDIKRIGGVDSVSGTVSRIAIRESGFAVPQLSTIYAAIRTASATDLLVSHPVLGDLRLPWRRIHRIEPLGNWEQTVIHAAPIHLGNNVRDDFEVTRPSGTTARFAFRLNEKPTMQVALSLLAADVEPGGPNTLKARSRLAEIRKGHFTTQVWVNDSLVGTLNESVSHLWKVGQPKRIELAIPVQHFTTGINRLTIKQHPSQSDSLEFDDCEIRLIAIQTQIVR